MGRKNRDVVAFNYIRVFITIAYYKFIYSLFDDIVIFPFITRGTEMGVNMYR